MKARETDLQLRSKVALAIAGIDFSAFMNKTVLLENASGFYRFMRTAKQIVLPPAGVKTNIYQIKGNEASTPVIHTLHSTIPAQ